MIGLVQRVLHAKVEVEGRCIGQIGQGLLVLVGVQPHDSEKEADKLLHKLQHYRIFSDEAGKMNRSLIDIQGELLLVSQFTLAANTDKGLRPSFSKAAPPAQGKALFDYLVAEAKRGELGVASGEFAADMQVSLCNDGPVTFWLEV